MGYIEEALELNEKVTDELIDRTDEVLKRIKDRIDNNYSFEDVIDVALENAGTPYLNSSFGDKILDAVVEASEQVINEAMKATGIKATVEVTKSKSRYRDYDMTLKSPYLKETGDAYDMIDYAIDIAEKGVTLIQWLKPDTHKDEFAAAELRGNDAFVQRIAKDSGFTEYFQSNNIEFDLKESNIYLVLKKDASLDIDMRCTVTENGKSTTVSKTVEDVGKHDAKLYEKLLDTVDDHTYESSSDLRPEIDKFWEVYKQKQTKKEQPAQKKSGDGRDDI